MGYIGKQSSCFKNKAQKWTYLAKVSKLRLQAGRKGSPDVNLHIDC